MKILMVPRSPQNPPFPLDVVPRFQGVLEEDLHIVVMSIYDLAAEIGVAVEISSESVKRQRLVSYAVAIRSMDPESPDIEEPLDALRQKLIKDRLITA